MSVWLRLLAKFYAIKCLCDSLLFFSSKVNFELKLSLILSTIATQKSYFSLCVMCPIVIIAYIGRWWPTTSVFHLYTFILKRSRAKRGFCLWMVLECLWTQRNLFLFSTYSVTSENVIQNGLTNCMRSLQIPHMLVAGRWS